ncbi:hypothetical protein AA309_26575 [Microvirga vignae]|uniref:Uncharacterized protein n=1 Tax=Microvirga vignae TaxID=1225564 RepID=A0A0H1R5J5_9HYPH|nr:hypothetical protein [Microvirga vignae]KLK90299.1 hypothetical protein AA309_26575 [Microvirga vignae]
MRQEHRGQIVAERLRTAAALLNQTDSKMAEHHEALLAKGYAPEDAAQMLYEWAATLAGTTRPATVH